MSDTTFISDVETKVVGNNGNITSYARTNVSVTQLSNGGYVVVWEQEPWNTTPGTLDIFAQVYDANGNEVGNNIAVNTTTALDQSGARVTGLDGGGFVVTWVSDGQDGDGTGIYSQAYDNAGLAIGTETLVNTATAGNQKNVDITELSSGGYVIGWTEELDNGNGTWTVSAKLQKFTSAGVKDGGEVLLGSTPSAVSVFYGVDPSYREFSVAELTGGEIVASWNYYDAPANSKTQMQILDTTGGLLGALIEPEQTTDDPGTLSQPEIVPLGNGNFIVFYIYSHGTNGSAGVGYGQVMGRIYDASGNAVGNEFAIAGGTDTRKFDIFAESDGNGGALIGWTEESDTSNDTNMVLQQMAQDGSLQGEPMVIDLLDNGFNRFVEVTLLGNGDALVAWQSGGSGSSSDISYRIIKNGEDGRFTPGSDTVTLGNGGEVVAALEGDDNVTGGNGNDVISGGTGNDTINGGLGDDILDGGIGNDTIDGGGNNDFINGGAGTDTLNGGAGDDTIVGGAGDDTINGDANNDTLYGDGGADTINGGAGNDTIFGYYGSYVDDLRLGDTDADANFTNILNGDAGDDLIFGAQGDDIINGGDDDDTLLGGIFSQPTGNDMFIGSRGNDTIDGMDGFDTLDYSFYGAGQATTIGITIVVHTNFNYEFRVTMPAIGSDPGYEQNVSGIEYFIGTKHNDSMTGNDDDNTFEGGLGNDFLSGGLGNDTVSYSTSAVGVSLNLDVQGVQQNTVGAGFDTIVGMENVTGSDHNDTLLGNAGVNIIKGGDGNDIIRGRGGADDLQGGGGNDTIYIDHLDTNFQGGTGFDRLFAEAGSGALNIDLAATGFEYAQGGGNNDILNAAIVTEAVSLFGNGGMDTLTGSAYADYINGGSGDDTMVGNAGADILDGSTGADSFDGGAGDDIFYIDADDTSVIGGADYDRAYVRGYSAGVNMAVGSTVGLEFVNGNAQNDIFDGSASTTSVKLLGQGGNDTLTGGSANDELYGGPGDDTLNGNGGDDILNASTGADSLYGGAGDDILYMDEDDLVINGGADYDRVYANGGSGALTLNMTTAEVEFVSGSAFGDNFTAAGSTVAVKIKGEGGGDTLTGGNVNDEIYGGAGTDTINGGTGDDFLSGGSEADIFVFDANWGADTVSDFQDGIDMLDLSSLGIGFGDLTVTQLGANNTLIEYNGQSITLIGVMAADVNAADFDFLA